MTKLEQKLTMEKYHRLVEEKKDDSFLTNYLNTILDGGVYDNYKKFRKDYISTFQKGYLPLLKK